MILLLAALQDTPVTCYNDQVLGTWRVNLSAFDRVPRDDGVRCPERFDVASTVTLQVVSPNLVIDQDGNAGTWSQVSTQALEVRVGGREHRARPRRGEHGEPERPRGPGAGEPGQPRAVEKRAQGRERPHVRAAAARVRGAGALRAELRQAEEWQGRGNQILR